MERKWTLVLSVFPGVGKTTLFNAVEELRNGNALSPERRGELAVILDSDSSQFSWSEPGVRHPDFPNNYIQHIQENIGKADIILTSTHKVVRDALEAADINFIVVVPQAELKEEYIQRYITRNSPEGFVKLMTEKWDEFVSEIMGDEETLKIMTGKGQYLSHLLDYKDSYTEDFLRQGLN